MCDFLSVQLDGIAARGRGIECQEFLGGGNGGFGGGLTARWDQVTGEIGESFWFHGFPATTTSPWDYGGIDGVVCFLKPFVFAFTAEYLLA